MIKMNIENTLKYSWYTFISILFAYLVYTEFVSSSVLRPLWSDGAILLHQMLNDGKLVFTFANQRYTNLLPQMLVLAVSNIFRDPISLKNEINAYVFFYPILNLCLFIGIAAYLKIKK
jgi:hypothetical protein